jgi:hypothetical protein
MNTLAVLAAAALCLKALHELAKSSRAKAEKRRAAIVDFLAENPDGATVTAISEAAGHQPGTIFVDLARLEANRHVTSWWVPSQPPPDGTPRRRYYGLAKSRSTWNGK